jgi:hypothetical protein
MAGKQWLCAPCFVEEASPSFRIKILLVIVPSATVVFARAASVGGITNWLTSLFRFDDVIGVLGNG